MRNIKDILNPNDQDFLNSSRESSWIPKEPKEVLLPYQTAEENFKEEENDIDQRRGKAIKIYNGYSKLIKECEVLEQNIEDQCKTVSVSLDPSNGQRVKEAMARVFGQGLPNSISFDQYKACIKALAAINNNLPNPGDK